MISKRDNYILLLNFFIISYLTFRYNVINGFDYLYFDICFIHIIILMLCQLEFGYRYFVMTISKLGSYSCYGRLNYCYYLDSSNNISDIYVRVITDDDSVYVSNDKIYNTDNSWYLLDRYLLFPDGISKSEYTDFVSRYRYVNELSIHMLKLYEDSDMLVQYNLIRSDYKFKYYASNILVLISLMFNIFLFSNI